MAVYSYISVPSQFTIQLPVTSQTITSPAVLSQTVTPPTAIVNLVPSASQNQKAPSRGPFFIRLGSRSFSAPRGGRRLPTPPIEQPISKPTTSQAGAQLIGSRVIPFSGSENNSSQSFSPGYVLQVVPRCDVNSSIVFASQVPSHPRSHSTHSSHLRSPSNPLPTLPENPSEAFADISESPRASPTNSAPLPLCGAQESESDSESKSLAAAEARHRALITQIHALTALENESQRSVTSSGALSIPATSRATERMRLPDWIANSQQNQYGSLPDRVDFTMGHRVGSGLVHDFSLPEGLAQADSITNKADIVGERLRDEPLGPAQMTNEQLAQVRATEAERDRENIARELADLRRLVLEDESLRERIARESIAFRSRIAQENECLRKRITCALREHADLLARVQLMRHMLLSARRELIDRLEGTDVWEFQ